MIITITTSITVDVDSIKAALFETCLEICYDIIPEFPDLPHNQQDAIRNEVWSKIVK